MTDAADSLDSILQQLAREAAPEVLARVLSDGQAEAKDLLQRRFVQHLMEEVGRLSRGEATDDRAAPTPVATPIATECEPGWYVYAITTGVDPQEVTGWPGVEDTTTDAIVDGDLVAVISRVAGRTNGWGIGEDGEPDLASLAPRVQEHERVLEGLLGLGAVLPMRFGTLYRTRSAVSDVLITHRAGIASALSRVKGRVEWGLTVTWNVDRASAALAIAEGPVPGSSRADDAGTPGRSYLSRRGTEKALAERLDEARRRISADLHASLGEVAAAGVVHRISGRSPDRPNANPSDEPLLKASYLVASDDSDRFQKVIVDRLEAAAAVGLRGDLTGPWPPYNFAALELEGALP